MIMLFTYKLLYDLISLKYIKIKKIFSKNGNPKFRFNLMNNLHWNYRLKAFHALMMSI